MTLNSNTVEFMEEFNNKHIIVPLDIKKAGEGISHNSLKQTLYRLINNAKQGKCFQHASGPTIILHQTEGTAYLECCKDYDGVGFQPDITFVSRATSKPDTVIEVVDSNSPNSDKILAYIKEDINVIIVKTSEVTYDQGYKHTCPAKIIFKTDSMDEKIKKAFYMCFKLKHDENICIGHNENNKDYFLGLIQDSGAEGVKIKYHYASRPNFRGKKLETKANKQINNLAKEFVNNTSAQPKITTLNNNSMYKQMFRLEVLKINTDYNYFLYCKILDKNCTNAFEDCNIKDCIGVIFTEDNNIKNNDIIYVNLHIGDYSRNPAFKNFYPRGMVSEEEFNKPIKKLNVNYWRIDIK